MFLWGIVCDRMKGLSDTERKQFSAVFVDGSSRFIRWTYPPMYCSDTEWCCKFTTLRILRIVVCGVCVCWERRERETILNKLFRSKCCVCVCVCVCVVCVWVCVCGCERERLYYTSYLRVNAVCVCVCVCVCVVCVERERETILYKLFKSKCCLCVCVWVSVSIWKL